MVEEAELNLEFFYSGKNKTICINFFFNLNSKLVQVRLSDKNIFGLGNKKKKYSKKNNKVNKKYEQIFTSSCAIFVFYVIITDQKPIKMTMTTYLLIKKIR
ncbi:hypothetical protein BpHYR1_006925 [Brachionus plicatilis]|uniref:Uncharacterized protein n=1 Tax=Brachionus plicatilis TaxID=10195 RepID=A0A3M7PY11_BRAPC|nr:hypothetical protein BpHYR1_006925 [Brachionus plicatilis]